MLLRLATSLLVTALTLLATPAFGPSRGASSSKTTAKRAFATYSHHPIAIATSADELELDELGMAIARPIASLDIVEVSHHFDAPVEDDVVGRRIVRLAPKTSPPRA